MLCVLALAILALLSQGLLHSLNYFETVNQVLAKRASFGTEVMRLEGVVKPGTIDRTSNGASFVLEGSGHNHVFVDAHGSPPELFQADIPVVVVGHFAGSSFVSDQLIVDHTAQYVQAHPNRVRAPNGTTR